MPHKTKIVDYKKLSDGQFAVLVECCGDEKHRSWHTMGPEVLTDESARAKSIAENRERVALQHEAAQQAEAHLAKMVGHEQEH